MAVASAASLSVMTLVDILRWLVLLAFIVMNCMVESLIWKGNKERVNLETSLLSAGGRE